MAGARWRLVASAGALLAALASPGFAAGELPLQPTFLGIGGLETARLELEQQAARGDWPRLGPGPALALGARGPEVVRLRERLAATGEASEATSDPETFDAALDADVRSFQRRHGLEPDGRVGSQTRAELDLGPRNRVLQLDRVIASRRALPDVLGRRFLLVNLSAFMLEAIVDGGVATSRRVVVGRVDRPTPTLASAVRSIVVHPEWNVPPRIAREEIAARALRDPSYPMRLGFELVAEDGTAHDVADVDWSAFRRGDVELTLRQRPGPLNALGAVAFQFPNSDNVALHDTPEQALFTRARRAESHACLRVEGAVELGRWLLAEEPAATRDAYERALFDGPTTRELALVSPVPIYIVDWPAWIDAEGRLQFRPEVYPDSRRAADSECG